MSERSANFTLAKKISSEGSANFTLSLEISMQVVR
jgi:hypothetical protein